MEHAKVGAGVPEILVHTGDKSTHEPRNSLFLIDVYCGLPRCQVHHLFTAFGYRVIFVEFCWFLFLELEEFFRVFQADLHGRFNDLKRL